MQKALKTYLLTTTIMTRGRVAPSLGRRPSVVITNNTIDGAEVAVELDGVDWAVVDGNVATNTRKLIKARRVGRLDARGNAHRP